MIEKIYISTKYTISVRSCAPLFNIKGIQSQFVGTFIFYPFLPFHEILLLLYRQVKIQMLINQNYQFPSELQDSSQEEFDFNKIQYLKNPIQARNQYELDHSQLDPSQDLQRSSSNSREIEIDYSMDNSSFQHDKFLEMIQKENHENQQAKITKPSINNEVHNYLMVDRSKIDKTLLRSQSCEQTISLRNPTSTSMKIKFNECSFQIKSIKTLSYVIADQIQIILQAWERIQVTFLIKQNQEEYGDIIQNIIITSQFLNRSEMIAPLEIKFNIHFVVPRLKLKFQGKYSIINPQTNQMTVIKVQPNQFGQYSLNFALMEGVGKCQFSIETRGKITCGVDKLQVRENDFSELKVRTRFMSNKDKQKSVIICRPEHTKICYLFGLQFMQ